MTHFLTKYLSPIVLGVTVFASTSVLADALDSTFSFLIVDVDVEGKEALVERASVKPGEIIHYVLSHENTTEAEMQGLVIVAPVPEGVTLTSDKQSSSVASVFEVQAELDPELEGLEWSTLPAMRKVVDTDGTQRVEALADDEIKAVRWSFSEALEAGDIAQNTYRVRVN